MEIRKVTEPAYTLKRAPQGTLIYRFYPLFILGNKCIKRFRWIEKKDANELFNALIQKVFSRELV